MKYMGSKARFAKEILPIILKDKKPEQWYVEPFAGGMNVICEFGGKRIANDNNYYLIEMWKGLANGNKYPTEIPKESIIYCDIPYQGTKQYSTSKDFNHSAFWDWCREKARQGHTIFVSEYNAPADFECVWQKQAKSSLSANGKIGGNKLSVEKLFKFSPTNVQ